MRRALVLAGIVVAVGAAIAAINRLVDPKNEFYSGAPLTEALESNCLLADDVVRTRSYPEFKRDLFSRRKTKTVVFDSNAAIARGVDLGFPGFGPETLLDEMQALARATPEGRRLNVYVVTNVSWFDPDVPSGDFDTSLTEKARYLLSPWTFASSLDLMRRSRKLAFTGWEKQRAGGTCVVDRGTPFPAWRPDGKLAGVPPEAASTAPASFAWNRLTSLDQALAIARARHWRVVGLSGLTPRWETYEHELRALFAKHGYRWRIRRMQT
ncbi:MAG TPA: hypothetical protein VF232_01385 [Gaiellaceae bacterium]